MVNNSPQPRRNPAATPPQPRRNPATPAFNGVNRGVYIADNLDFLRAINTGSVDLVCIDPPFAKNDTFTGDKLKPPLSKAETANEKRLLKRWGIATPEQADAAGIAWPDDPKARGGYKDQWSWEQDIHEDWVDGIKTTHPAVNLLIEATREIHGDGIAAYLCFMAIRLFEIHRVLKPTGILYLHCDHTANGYLRQLMDGVFGADNLVNQIFWQRTGSMQKGSQYNSRTYGNMTDTILCYAKTSQYYLWPYRTLKDEEASAKFPLVDTNGERYNTATPLFCSRSMGARPNLCYEWRGYTNPHPSGWRLSKERLEEEYRKGNVVILPDGKLERRSYLKDYIGVPLGNLWDDPGMVMGSGNKERTGYPTQKPIALAERIIQASTNPGDVVLDCFAGCAYAAVAAEKLGRQWVACDINPRAWTVFKRQFNKGGDLPLLTCNDRTTGQQVMGSEPTVTVHGPEELPERTTGVEVEVKPLRATAQRERAAPKYKRASTLLSDREMKEILLRLSDGKAWCCGYESKNADHSLNLGDYELDHIIPKSRGGDDDIINRAPLCPTHNVLKSNHNWTLPELRIEVAFRQELKPGMTPTGLQRLDVALDYAQQERQKAYERRQGNTKPLGI